MPIPSKLVEVAKKEELVEEIGAVDDYAIKDNQIFHTFSIRDPSNATTVNIRTLIDSGSTHIVLGESVLNKSTLTTELVPEPKPVDGFNGS